MMSSVYQKKKNIKKSKQPNGCDALEGGLRIRVYGACAAALSGLDLADPTQLCASTSFLPRLQVYLAACLGSSSGSWFNRTNERTTRQRSPFCSPLKTHAPGQSLALRSKSCLATYADFSERNYDISCGHSMMSCHCLIASGNEEKNFWLLLIFPRIPPTLSKWMVDGRFIT